MVSEKKDLYKYEKHYKSWQDKNKNGIVGISKNNSDIILKYLYDMEYGGSIVARII